jgi:hypothetical protein
VRPFDAVFAPEMVTALGMPIRLDNLNTSTAAALSSPVLSFAQQHARMIAEPLATDTGLMPAAAVSSGSDLASWDAFFASPDMWWETLPQR